jgi:hypothetical protein
MNILKQVGVVEIGLQSSVLAFDSENSLLAISEPKGMRFLHLDTFEIYHDEMEDLQMSTFNLNFSQNGEFIFKFGFSNHYTFKKFDVKKKKTILQTKIQNAISMHPIKENFILVTQSDKMSAISLIDFEKKKKYKELKIEASVETFVNEKKNLLFVWSNLYLKLFISTYETDGLQFIEDIPFPTGVKNIGKVFELKNENLVLSDFEGSLYLYEKRQKKYTKELNIKFKGPISIISFKNYIICINQQEQGIFHLIDPVTMIILETHQMNLRITSMVNIKDDYFILGSCHTHEIFIWAPESEKKVQTFSSDGKRKLIEFKTNMNSNQESSFCATVVKWILIFIGVHVGIAFIVFFCNSIFKKK